MPALGQKLPRRSPAGAAAIPPITDAKADVRRGRDGPEADMLGGRILSWPAIWQRSCWVAAEATFDPEAVAHVEPE